MESDYDDYYEMLDLEIGKCYFALCAYPEYKEKHFEFLFYLDIQHLYRIQEF